MTEREEFSILTNNPHLSLSELVNIFTEAPICIFKSTETGKLLYINQTGAEMFGYSSPKIMIDHINSKEEGTTILYPYSDIRLSKIENVLNCEGWVITTNAFRCKDGTVFTGKSYVRKVPYTNDEWAFQGFIKDITETKESADSTLEQQIIERLININVLAMSYVDKNGKVIFSNKKHDDLFEISRQETVSRTFDDKKWQIIDYEGKPFSEKLLPVNQVMSKNRAVYGIKHAVKKVNGEMAYLDVNSAPIFDNSGNVEGVISSIADLTPLVESKRIIEQSEKLYRSLSDITSLLINAPIHEYEKPIMQALSKIGNYLSGVDSIYIFEISKNRETFSMIHEWCGKGISKQKSILQNLPVDDFHYVFTNLRNNEILHVPAVDKLPDEATAFKNELQRETIKSTLHVGFYQHGKLTGFLGLDSMRDYKNWTETEISYCHLVSSSLNGFIQNKNYIDLLMREKRELSAFAEIISHDINNNLTIIEGFLDLSIEDEENTTPYLKKMKDKICQTRKTLTKSLELAKAGQIIGELEQINIKKMVDEIADSLPQVDISCTVIPSVKGDKQKVRQILANIFSNAIQHGNASEIEVTNKKNVAGGFTIQICNNGEKISKEIIDKIWKKRFTTKNDHQGLGLNIVQRIIQAHGWVISVTSTETKTCFNILIK